MLCYGNFNIIYCTIVSPILFNILPIISIFIINIFIFFKIRRFNLAQNPSLNSSRLSKRNSETLKRSNLSTLVKNFRPFSHACTQKSYYIIMVFIVMVNNYNSPLLLNQHNLFTVLIKIIF
jgi:hypothetical protein